MSLSQPQTVDNRNRETVKNWSNECQVSVWRYVPLAIEMHTLTKTCKMYICLMFYHAGLRDTSAAMKSAAAEDTHYDLHPWA